MHRLFGKPKNAAPAPPPPTLGDAAQGIHKRIQDLDLKIKGLEAELVRYREQMKRANGAAKSSIERRAMETLKRRNTYIQQRDQLNSQMFNIDQTAFTLQSVKDHQMTVAALKEASATLKTESTKIDLDAVENMQDDLEDMFEDMNEVNEALSRSYATGEYMDEGDLEAELACLGEEFDDPVGSELPSYLMPEAPTAALTTTPVAADGTPVTTAPAAGELDAYGLPSK
jgi:charged multivesicular body protein 5